jgi:uncharacterized protein (UPF0371 family)
LTRACNLLGIRSKPNKKVTNKKWHLFKESPSIIEAIKEYSQTTKELELLKMQMIKEIMT